MTVKFALIDNTKPLLNPEVPDGTLAAALAAFDRACTVEDERMGSRGEVLRFRPKTPKRGG